MTVDSNDKSSRPATPYRMRLPGFISDEPVGLGDAVKRATSLVGIRPCGPCTARAQKLNSWVVLTGRRR